MKRLITLGFSFLMVFALSAQKEEIVIEDRNSQEVYSEVKIATSNRYSRSSSSCLELLDDSYVSINESLYGLSGYPAYYPEDDGSYGPIDLGFTFQFYGEEYNSLYINVNGNVTFGNLYSAYSASGFPSNNVPAMIAPFWGDVDLRGTSNAANQIYYKLEDHRIIIQWLEVGHYNQRNERVNSFQLVLSDGQDETLGLGYNARFAYDDMSWCVGDASGGNNGFGNNVYATVGAQTEGGGSYYQIGLFGRDNYTYDGAGGELDGVHYLDGRCFTMDLSSSNVPPIANDFPVSKTVNLCSGMAYTLNTSYASPEVNQTTSVEVISASLSDFNVTSVDGNLSVQTVAINTTEADTGSHFIVYKATDNGTPIGVTIDTLFVNVYSCNEKGNSASLEFDGVDDYVEVLHSEWLHPGGENTFAIWFNPNNDQVSNQVLVSKNNQFEIGISTNKKAYLKITKSDGEQVSLSSSNEYNSEDWNYIVCRQRSDELAILLNQTWTILPVLSNDLDINVGGSSLLIGRNADNDLDNYYSGKLDELSFWSSAFSDIKSEELVYEAQGSSSSYLRLYYKFYESFVLENFSNNSSVPDGLVNGLLMNFDLDNCWKNNYASVWDGTEDHNFNNFQNWEDNQVPQVLSSGSIEASDLVIIPSNKTLVFTSEIEVPTIVFCSNNLVQFDSDASLRIHGDLISFESPNYGEGEVLFVSNIDQRIRGLNNFHDLVVNNDVYLDDSCTVRGVMTLNTNIFYTNGNPLLFSSDEFFTGQIFHNSGTISGDVIMQRYLKTDTSALGWHYVSSPMQNTKLSQINDDFTLVGLGNTVYDSPWPNLYFYDETVESPDKLQGWYSGARLDQNISPLQGFIIYSPERSLTIDFEGEVNSGEYSVSLSNTFSGKESEDGWNLLANPYPGMLDWNMVSVPNNMDNAYYVYDHKTDKYATYVDGLGTNNATNLIASHQSFFVHVDQDLNFTLTNSARTSGDNSNLHRNHDIQEIIKVKVRGIQGSDEMILRFSSSGYEFHDPEKDARKIGDVEDALSIYTSENEMIYSINTLPFPSQELSVPINISGGTTGNATIYIDLKDLERNNLNQLYLKDNQLNKVVDVFEEPEYTFNYDQEADYERFSLIYYPVQISNSNQSNKETGLIEIYGNLIRFDESIGIVNLKIFDTSGRMIYDRNMTERYYDLSVWEKGIYLVQVSNNVETQSLMTKVD